jgi:hypothetical protein
MGDGQARLVHGLLAEQEEVEVDRARPPAFLAHAAEALLDRQQALEQLPRTEIGLDPNGAVQEGALLHGPDGLGLADLGHGGDVDSVLRGEQFDGAPEVALTVAQV